MLLNSTIGTKEQGETRATAKSLAQTTRINNNILRMLGESAQRGEEINFLGGTGKGLNWVNNFVNNVKSAWREGGSSVGAYRTAINIGGVKDKEGGYEGGKSTTLKGLAEDKDSETAQALGEAMSALGYSGNMANKYQSQVMELAYATARANEPGARQLSDADIANALKIIGTNASNPEAMRQIFRDNVSRAVKRHEDNIAAVPRDLRGMIVSQDLEDRIQGELDTFKELSSGEYGSAAKPFGTEESPKEGLRNMDTAPEIDLDIRRPGMEQAIENARSVGAVPSESTAAPAPSTVPGLTSEEIAEQEAGIEADLDGLWLP